MQALAGDIEDDGGVIESEEDRLSSGVAGQPVILIGHRDAPCRLSRCMFDRTGVVTFLYDVIGFLESCLHIPEPDLAACAAVIAIIILPMIFVDERRSWLEGILDVEYRGQFFVVDADQSGRLMGASFTVGHDGDHRLAKPANLVESEHRFVFRPDIDQAQHGIDVVRNILCRNDPLDARMPLRCTRIDPQDACMVMWTADHAEVEKPWSVPVGVERRNASDVAGGVGALPRLADFLEIAMAFVGKITFTYFHHTAPAPLRRRKRCLQKPTGRL